jgi:hypothetical protein
MSRPAMGGVEMQRRMMSEAKARMLYGEDRSMMPGIFRMAEVTAPNAYGRWPEMPWRNEAERLTRLARSLVIRYEEAKHCEHMTNIPGAVNHWFNIGLRTMREIQETNEALKNPAVLDCARLQARVDELESEVDSLTLEVEDAREAAAGEDA